MSVKRFGVVSAVVAGCLCFGCASMAQLSAPPRLEGRSSVNAKAEHLPNIDFLKGELKQYHDCTCTCGCYTKDFDGQAEKAIAFLTRRAARREQGEKLAMVLDIDETSLTNWEELLKADFAYDDKAFTVWEETAKAPALGGTLRLYKAAQRLGVSVFFITGRPEGERAATERNLKAQGYEGWQGLALRPEHPKTQSTAEYKSGERAKIVAQGYTLVLNAGDQWSDLKGKPEAEYSVKYPNPFYYIP